MRGQELREDSVLCGRIGGGAETHDRIRDQRVDEREHHEAADHLDRIGDQHDAALRHRVRKGPDQRRQHDIGHEALLQRRRHPIRLVQLLEERNGGNQQRVVRERRKKLRRHDRVETGLHFL